MKSHKYWSIGALITMLGTFYTGYKGSKEGHKYFAASSLLCMIMAIYPVLALFILQGLGGVATKYIINFLLR